MRASDEPLAAALVHGRARPRRTPAELRRGLLVGVLSFQPLWHFLLLPVLLAR